MRQSCRGVDLKGSNRCPHPQVLFWKLRAAQQDSYNNLYSPLKMKVGDLTDTLYFDFISFSQWAAVDKAIRDARQLFDEPCEECDEYTIKTIKRPPTLTDAMIPTSFEAGVGDRIYAGLRDGFNGETFGAPQAPNRGAPVEEVAAKVGDLVGVMERNGFCIKHDVALVPR